MESYGILAATSRKRLQENPLDLDVLFAKAAWLAKVKEYEKCIETLDIITKRDPSIQEYGCSKPRYVIR